MKKMSKLEMVMMTKTKEILSKRRTFRKIMMKRRKKMTTMTSMI